MRCIERSCIWDEVHINSMVSTYGGVVGREAGWI